MPGQGNNILRAPVLNAGVGESTPQEPPLNAGAPPFQSAWSQELRNLINSTVENAVRLHLDSFLQQNQVATNYVDECIEERFRTDIDQINRIPDVVRLLKEFSGDPSEFSSWRKSVTRILYIYITEKGTPRYFGIINVIRNKIIGNADIALESYNTPLNWEAILKCLTMHYGDKRDIGTLEFQLTSLRQGNDTIETYYQEVYSFLSLILNKISCMEIENSAISILTQTYRTKALDTFIRGLNGDLPMLLAIREPTDLPQALNLCRKLQNQNYRSTFMNNSMQPTRQTDLPPKPTNQQQQYQRPQPQRAQQQYQRPQQQYQNYQQQYLGHQQQCKRPQSQPQRQEVFPQLAHIPQQQNFKPSYNAQQIAPPRPAKPMPRGEPMDIDQTMLTRRVDYMNRPNQAKRMGSSFGNPNKKVRNFHITNAEQQEEDCYDEPTTAQLGEVDSEPREESFCDIHFLD